MGTINGGVYAELILPLRVCPDSLQIVTSSSKLPKHHLNSSSRALMCDVIIFVYRCHPHQTKSVSLSFVYICHGSKHVVESQ